MKASFTGNKLTVEVDLDLSKASRSGNSTILATSRGQQFIGNYKGRPTYLQLNVMQIGETGQEIELVGEVPKKPVGKAA